MSINFGVFLQILISIPSLCLKIVLLRFIQGGVKWTPNWFFQPKNRSFESMKTKLSVPEV